jgi:hypothetical protein
VPPDNVSNTFVILSLFRDTFNSSDEFLALSFEFFDRLMIDGLRAWVWLEIA